LRQKEAKAEAEEAARERSELEARRPARAGPAAAKGEEAASIACDFCQKVVKGKRRSHMFQRLEYAYCTTKCVKGHQRESTAAAATRRSQQ
jgi:hypothetical protein